MTASPAPLRVMIVDDEVHARDFVRHLLQRHPDVTVVGEAGNGPRALEEIRRHRPDLLFLDIHMPKQNGLELIDALGDTVPPVIVFTTAHDDHAVSAFERCAFDYLLKPINPQRFDRTLARARERLRTRSDADLGRQLRELVDRPAAPQASPPLPTEGAPAEPATGPLTRLVIKDAGRVYFVPVASVDWLEAAGNYVAVRVGGRSHLVHETLAALEQKLDPRTFLRIHRSTVVNVDRIKELQPFANGEFIVILHDGTKLKLSRSFRERADQVLGLGRGGG